jgi:multimeric flavodoxin WrbA
MKVLTFLGSPRKNGKTAEALMDFEKIIALRGHEVERINLTEHRINGCLGCYACMGRQDVPGCVQKDDAAMIFGKLASADAVVYASPIFCFDLSAQMKTLIDRHFCLLNTSIPNGKKTALLLTCAGPAEGNADLAQEVFRRCFDGASGGAAKTEMVGRYVVPKSNDPDFSTRAQAIAEQIADDLDKR